MIRLKALLNLTDIYTGWVETRVVMGKGEGGIVVALDEMRAALPFALQTIDSDNGQDVCELCLMLCAPPGGVYRFQLCGYLPLYKGDARSRPLKSDVTLWARRLVSSRVDGPTSNRVNWANSDLLDWIAGQSALSSVQVRRRNFLSRKVLPMRGILTGRRAAPHRRGVSGDSAPVLPVRAHD